MRSGIIIQARMGSQRLPGKSLKLLCGIPIIERCFEQCKKSTFTSSIVIAIPDSPSDDRLAAFCTQKGYDLFRGHPTNLHDRYYNCAKHFGFDTIARITGDNPLLDPSVIDTVFKEHLRTGADYTSTRHWDGETLHGLYPAGLSVDVFGQKLLVQMMEDTLSEDEKEHIVYYPVRRQNRYKIAEVSPPEPLQYSFTIDTPEDFTKIEALVRRFERSNVPFTYQSYLRELHQRGPE